MVDVASSLYHARFSTRFLRVNQSRGFIDFSRGKKKKNVFRLTHARHGMPGYCFKFEGYGNGEPVVGGGGGGWFFRMDRGGWLDYGVLSGIFWMIGFASVVIPWVMNWFLMVKHGLNGWIFE